MPHLLLLSVLFAAFIGPADDAALIKAQLPLYPLDTCVVSDEALHGEDMGNPIDLVHEGRLVRLCCKGCKREFAESPADALAKIDAAVIARQSATYPLETCVVSGEELGKRPLDRVHGMRLVRLCCPGCEEDFNAAPRAFLDKIDAALIRNQRESYPLQTCLMSGEPLGGRPVDQLYGTQLVRFCCKRCAATFDADPAKHIGPLREAVAAAHKARELELGERAHHESGEHGRGEMGEHREGEHDRGGKGEHDG